MANSDLEVDLKQNGDKAIIKGKTSVPFAAFVKLVTGHQLKNLLPERGEDPIIVDSSLLTKLASAPQESRANQAKLTLVTLGSGFLAGVFVMSVLQIALISVGKTITKQHFMAVVAVLIALVILVVILDRLRRRKKADKLTDIMESVAALFSK